MSLRRVRVNVGDAMQKQNWRAIYANFSPDPNYGRAIRVDAFGEVDWSEGGLDLPGSSLDCGPFAGGTVRARIDCGPFVGAFECGGFV